MTKDGYNKVFNQTSPVFSALDKDGFSCRGAAYVPPPPGIIGIRNGMDMEEAAFEKKYSERLRIRSVIMDEGVIVVVVIVMVVTAFIMFGMAIVCYRKKGLGVNKSKRNG